MFSKVHNYNLLAVASPLLHQLMSEAADHVPAPHKHSNMSLLELWRERNRFTGDKLVGYGLSSVSDHAPFYQRAGIPCTYMLWMPNPVSKILYKPLNYQEKLIEAAAWFVFRRIGQVLTTLSITALMKLSKR